MTTTHLIDRLPSRSLDSHSPIQLLTKFFLDFNASNGLNPKVFSCVSFVHIHTPHRGILNPRALKCIFVGYYFPQEGYKCYHPPTKKFLVSTDVTFVEDNSYFVCPYLQGETSFLEDKNKDLFLLDFPSSSTPLVSNSKDSQDMIQGEQPPTSSCPLQVYSRRKASAPQPMQATLSEPGLGPGITTITTIPTPGTEPISNLDPNDLDLPIIIKKGTRTCTKHHLHLFMSYTNLSH